MMFTNLTSYLLLIALCLVLYFVCCHCCLPFIVRFDNCVFEGPFRIVIYLVGPEPQYSVLLTSTCQPLRWQISISEYRKMSCLQNIVEKHFAPQKVEHFNNTAFVDYLYQLSCFLRRRVRRMLGPFIREKISRRLRKTWTPRINGTKSTFTAYSTHGQLKSRLILADEFWIGLIQAAAYRGRESVCVNALIDRLVRDTAVTVGLGTLERFRRESWTTAAQ